MNAHFYGPLPQALQALAAISPAWAARLPELQSALLPAPKQGGQRLVSGMCCLADGQTMLVFDRTQLLCQS